MVWVIAVGIAALAPALAHGTSLGPFDILASFSHQPGVVIHNPQTVDQILEMIPWTNQAWVQVHQGHLPLWNPDSVLGMPLAFNWQSAPFGIPALVGYLAPARLAYTVGVLVTVAIAGAGAYVLGRVLRLSVLAAVMAGTVFELSGPFFSTLGWPISSVMSWAGWLFALAILIVRGGHRFRNIVLLAVVVACSIYAGQPDTLVVLILFFVVFIGMVLAVPMMVAKAWRTAIRPLLDLFVGCAAGAALGAPLILPGLQLTGLSVRLATISNRALRPSDISHLAFQSFDGTPISGSVFFGDVGYVPTAVYLGVIVLVLAVVAVALRRRVQEVIALGAVSVAATAAVFAPPVTGVLNALPHGTRVQWARSTLVLALALAVLAGMGLDLLARSWRDRTLRRWAGGGFAVCGVLILGLWTFGRGHLPPAEAAIRTRSFIWPSIETVVGLGVMALIGLALSRSRRADSAAPSVNTGRWAAGVLLLVETAFLVSVGAPIWSSSPTFFAHSKEEVALHRAVGSSLVGFGADMYTSSFGVTPNANIAYGIRELAVYDPLVPHAYFQAWKKISGVSAHKSSVGPPSIFFPWITTAREARRFGVSFVLELPGHPGPTGGVLDRFLGTPHRVQAVLYRIPDAATATLTGLVGDETRAPSAAPGRAVAVTHPDPSSWKLVTDSHTRSVLRLRLTDVPGWHASIDGKPLPLRRFAGVMLEADIPAGTHTVELRYWPSSFSIGIVLALCSVITLGVGTVIALSRQRRRRAGPAVVSGDAGSAHSERPLRPTQRVAVTPGITAGSGPCMAPD